MNEKVKNGIMFWIVALFFIALTAIGIYFVMDTTDNLSEIKTVKIAQIKNIDCWLVVGIDDNKLYWEYDGKLQLFNNDCPCCHKEVKP